MQQISPEASIVLAWREDNLRFVREVFGVEPTTQQTAYLKQVQAMVNAKIRVNTQVAKGKTPHLSNKDIQLSKKFGLSVMAGVGTGKGAVATWIVMWFLLFPAAKICVTGASAKQISVTLWAELAKWHQKCRIKDWFTWQSDKFYFNEANGQQWFAFTRTSNTRNSAEEQAETLAGLHEDYLLIICDEASGIPDPVFRPLESTLTRLCNLCLLFFNPTRAKGYAYDTHYRDRENWVQVHWNAEESEMVTKESIERLEKKFGRDSNSFRIRVLGLPPVSGENTVIPWEWIVDAVDREVEPMDGDPLIYSLDVGAGGDESALCREKGPLIYPISTCNYADSNLLIHWAVKQILDGRPKACMVDSAGVGWAVPGTLRKQVGSDTRIVEVNVASSAFNPHRFYRLRDELWWRTRERFEKGSISIPDDAILMGELNAPQFEEPAGKIKVEDKKHMKQRGLDSPNRADSLIMCSLYEKEVTRKLFSSLYEKQKKKKSSGSWRTT